MKKRVYVVSMFLIIFTSIITSFIFQAYRKVEDFKEFEEEVVFLENIILNEERNLDDKDKLNSFLENHTRILNSRIDIKYKDGTELSLNNIHREIVYESRIEEGNALIDRLDIYQYEENTNSNYIKSLLSAIIISIIIALFFIGRFIKDDEKVYDLLISGIEKNKNGKMNKIDLKRKDEKILLLEKNFNAMNKKIFETVEETKELNTKLKSIISSMTDGVLALDNEGNIILTNDFAEYILDLDNVRNISSLDASKKEKLLGLLNNGYKDDKLIMELDYPISKKIKVSRNPIKYHRYSNKKLGDLLIFEDVTQIDKLKTVKEDFVANVSHELKTPLTSLLGFVETLKSGALEDKNLSIRFLDIMEEEVIRMNTLIDDLLLLSEIESDKVDLSRESIDLNELIDSVFNIMENKYTENKIKLEKNIKNEEFLFFTNENYLRQLIINLVGNSIKYNRENGFVSVTCSKDMDYLYIDVLDNGIGIDDEDKERVFERFYRIDKSRSSEIDGTGLGLSIVKHIVSVFNGSLFIESSVDIGTLITVRLPIE